MEENNSGTAPSQVITINGQEFDPTEAEELITVGRQTRELEQKYNTKLDKVWPDYNDKSQRLSQAEKELAEARSELESFKTKKEQGTETPADLHDAKEAARKLGIVLKEDVEKEGYVKTSDLDNWYKTTREKERAVENVLSQADKLEKEIDGSDGRPKFNKRAVMAYAGTYGKTLEEAYEEMNEETLKPWKEQQIEAQKKKGLKTLIPGGEKAPSRPKVNRDNLKDLMLEALGEV